MEQNLKTMKKYDVIGNFQLVHQIESFNQLSVELDSANSIFYRHRMYPTAFIKNWTYERLKKELKFGRFWIANRISGEEVFKCDWCNKQKKESDIYNLGKLKDKNHFYRICNKCNLIHDVV